MPLDVREVHLALNNSPHGSDTPRDSLFEGSEMLGQKAAFKKSKDIQGRPQRDKFKQPNIYQGASTEESKITEAFAQFETELISDFGFSNKVCFMGQDKSNPNGMEVVFLLLQSLRVLSICHICHFCYCEEIDFYIVSAENAPEFRSLIGRSHRNIH